jgi:hypothetical protein
MLPPSSLMVMHVRKTKCCSFLSGIFVIFNCLTSDRCDAEAAGSTSNSQVYEKRGSGQPLLSLDKLFRSFLVFYSLCLLCINQLMFALTSNTLRRTSSLGKVNHTCKVGCLPCPSEQMRALRVRSDTVVFYFFFFFLFRWQPRPVVFCGQSANGALQFPLSKSPRRYLTCELLAGICAHTHAHTV